MKKIFLTLLLLVLLHSCKAATWNYGDIHVFGDSHAAYSFTNLLVHQNAIKAPTEGEPLTFEFSYFLYNNELSVPFHIYWISRTMHMIGKLVFEILDFKKYGVQEGDIALLHFGGIDSYHAHFIKQYNLGRDIEEIMDALARKFVAAVQANHELYDNITTVIMALTPPEIRPYHASIYVEREPGLTVTKFLVKAHRLLNAALKKYSQMNGFIYFDVTALFENEQGVLSLDRSSGDHHVKMAYNYLIKNELIKLLLEQTKEIPNH